MEKMEPILLRNCKFILDALNPLRKNKDILVIDGKIEKIGENLNKNGFIIDCEDCFVIPGMINAHTHSSMSLFRGIAEDSKLEDWLSKKIWPLESKLTAKDCYVGSKLSIMEMLTSGFVGAADMYFHMKEVAKAYIELNFRGLLCEGVFDFFREDILEEKINFVKSTFLDLKNINSELIKPSFGPHATYTCSSKLLKEIAELSKFFNAPVQIHVAETLNEQEQCLKRYGMREVEFLNSIGLCNKNAIFAHGVWLDDNEINILSKTGAVVVQNTISNLKLGTGSTCDIRKLLDSKVKVCLGTDGPASNNSLDAFEMLKFSSLYLKNMHKDPSVINSRELFRIVTYDSYKHLFPEIKGGLIEEGYVADLVVFDLNNSRFKPLTEDSTHIINHLVYSSSGIKAKHVIVNGKISVFNGRLVNVKEEDLIDEFENTFEELMKR